MEADWLRSRLVSGRSIESIAREAGKHPSTVGYWVNKHGLTSPHGTYRCGRCNSAAVAARRRTVKERLDAEAGGRCAACGFDSYVGALQFHHRDPGAKSFALSDQGVTRSLALARSEAAKCVLLCANCHAMVEAGLLSVPASADTEGSPTAGTTGPG
jgi:DNA-directed RNA polymerase subunit RPC12/RpoP